MGVKGLWSKVLRDYEEKGWNFVQQLKRNNIHLLVDATGFIFHLLDNQLPTLYPDIVLKREYGGSYREIENLISCEIKRLSGALGCNFTFYFDGPDSYFKGNTTMKRREQLLEQWSNLFYHSLGDSKQRTATSEKDLPLPPLFQAQLIHVLRTFGIKCIESAVEADQEMAVACSLLNINKTGKQYFCYTGDRQVLLNRFTFVVVVDISLFD
jgi:hypothetical protein